MNSKVNSERYTLPAAVGLFMSEVERCRHLLPEHISTFPAEIRSYLMARYCARVPRHDSPPLFGELAPWIMSDWLGVRDYSVAREIYPAWVFMYGYTLLADDQLDKPQAVALDPVGVLAAGMVLQKGLSLLCAIRPNASEWSPLLDESVHDAAVSALWELERRNSTPTPFGSEDLSALSRKSFLVRLCAGLLTLSTATPRLSTRARTSIDNLTLSLQLRDDITDWIEDLSLGNYTHVLSIAERSLPDGARLQRLSREQVLCTLVSSGALARTLELSTSSIQRATKGRPLEGTPTEAYVKHVVATNEELYNYAEAVRRQLPDCEEANTGSSEYYGRVANDISRKLKIVAQHT